MIDYLSENFFGKVEEENIDCSEEDCKGLSDCGMEGKRKDSGGGVGEGLEAGVPEYDLEDYHRTGGIDPDDEVFESETAVTENMVKEPRTRRISDVIDSVGDKSPGPNKRQSFPEFPETATSYLKKSQEFYLDVKDWGRSPPPTPCSDLGYESTSGLGSPPYNLIFRPKWFRFSSSSMDTTSPSKWDLTDAKPFNSFSNRESELQGNMPVERDSQEYNMSHARRGYAVIFNHEEFDAHDLPTRKGSDIDVHQLEDVYKMLGFDVTTFNNLGCNEIKCALRDLAEKNHTDCDCLLITVLTHGFKNNYLSAKDYIYPADSLWSPFTADKCTSLAGKPKIFVIQACRGEACDGGVKLVNNTQTDSDTASYKIPTMADFLIAYSTAEGFCSWRHPENGTWFIQSLCQVLSDNYHSLDFLKIMIRVSQRVAINYESYNDLDKDRHKQKQVPNLYSTLIRDIHFRPKV